MGIDLNKYKGSKTYFTAASLTAPLEVTVATVEERTIGRSGEEEEKLVLTFREDQRVLPLNKTRTQNMEDLFGEDTDRWLRRRVRLRRVRSTFGTSPWSIIIEAASPTRPARSESEPASEPPAIDETPPPDDPDWEAADAE